MFLLGVSWPKLGVRPVSKRRDYPYHKQRLSTISTLIIGTFIMPTKEDYEKMKVAELKTACKDLGLDFSGVKADLVARLHQELANTSEDRDTAMVDTALPAAATEAETMEAVAEALPVEQLSVVDVAETPAVEVSHSKHPKIVFHGKPSNVSVRQLQADKSCLQVTD